VSDRPRAHRRRAGGPQALGGRDFDESDEANIRELAALVGETLEALRLAAQQPA
jgi:hypothetical protein